MKAIVTMTERCDTLGQHFRRRGAPRGRNHPHLWNDRLYRQTHCESGCRMRCAPYPGRTKYRKGQSVAKPLGLVGRAFDLGTAATLDAALKDVSVVLCVAGPFSATARPMAEACIRNKVHYLDITGEIDVFEALAARDAEARRQGVMLLFGFVVSRGSPGAASFSARRRREDATAATGRHERSRGDHSTFNHRAAASAVSSGFVLKAIAALGAALWMALITVSNSSRLFGGSLRPPPITTQS